MTLKNVLIPGMFYHNCEGRLGRDGQGDSGLSDEHFDFLAMVEVVLGTSKVA